MALHSIMQTGQVKCYDAAGNEISCSGTGQDAEIGFGAPWPSPRFSVKNKIVHDQLTGLYWIQDGNLTEFPVLWQEALDFIRQMNTEKRFGFDDWRLPNRRELQSLISFQAKNPAIPENNPFTNYFLGWYWTSTSSAVNPSYAWYIHLEGARMFYGSKDQYCFFWPVRGNPNNLVSWSGQKKCYNSLGIEIPCKGSGQDGENRLGVAWPEPRFEVKGEIVKDRLTGLDWASNADGTGEAVNWQQALDAVKHLNDICWKGNNTWRLPNIKELESLVDSDAHNPALPLNHPFTGLRDGYWSSTTSYFETDWAWVFYLVKGACGVGYKPGKTFFVWPVCGT